MNKRQLYTLTRYPLVALALVWGQSLGTAPQAFAQTPAVDPTLPLPLQRMIRKTTNDQRKAAAAVAAAARAAAKTATAARQVALPSMQGAVVAAAAYPPGTIAPPGVMNPRGTPDYTSGLVPNWALSPVIRKFVDTLPGLGPTHANALGNYIPIATKDTTTYPGSDYYNIAVVDYTQKLHSDLPATKLRGYKDLAGGDGNAHYLGPVILATRDRPVRVKFENQLATGTAGNLFIPVDTSGMGAGSGPGGGMFTENRAELHLHGGLNPWISDGTPHQWITPAGDPTPLKKGASFQNVPDMGVGSDGDGIGTYYYTNQQSGRFLFYHDHSYGITRLNVYAGEAAGYLITDPVEEKLIDAGVLPNNGDPAGVYRYGIPLIIQDKSFVPGPSALAQQDPTWDTAAWGGYGQLWYPHVYMPNQDPSNSAGANPMGRWDYGPWFWPPLPVADPAPGTAPISIPLANGPKSLGPGLPDYPGTPNPSLVPEGFMDTAVVNGTPYPTVTLEPKSYRFRVLNASNDRPYSLSFYQADGTGTEVAMIDASPANAALGPVDANGVPLWPSDGRAGGVVSYAPTSLGPDIIQIGTESGFLPTPVVIPPQPTTYNYNRRDIVVLNIDKKALFLMPAERADVIVDFSAYAGKTLILYNDMLAPVPAFDVRYDYFTGAPDQTATGGAPPTAPGYGPNTRTLMQVKVAATAPAPAFNKAALDAAFTGTSTAKSAFAETQHPPIVPQTFYNSAMNTAYPADTYSTIQGNTLSFTKTENNQPVVMDLKPKAIQELFELDYGRMNATLGVELPFTNFNNQTTIPLAYTDPATEILKDGETQLWKITHNGVDSHPVHFHLFDVQIVNRVGWDGAVRFPDANEMGWKETVKMNPLEDIVVAFRPLSPRLPFTLSNSNRSNNPTKLSNENTWITDMRNPTPNAGNLGNMISVVNDRVNFGWEYVWHCHILGHEENDFMRPMALNVAAPGENPIAPTGLTAIAAGPTRVDLAWTETSTNETGFSVERSPAGANTFVQIGTTVPDKNNFTDMTTLGSTAYDYRVYAYNQAGPSAPISVVNVTPIAVVNPTSVTLAALPLTAAPKGTAVTFTATPTGGTGHQYEFLINGAIVQPYSAVASYIMPTTQAAGTFTVAVNVRTSLASAVVTAAIPYTITPLQATSVQLLPNFPSPQPAVKGIVFTAMGIGSSGYQYQFSVGGVIVQAYSTTNTYAFPVATTFAGTYPVSVDVRTNPLAVTPDATASLSYVISIAGPATGVTLTPDQSSPHLAGTAVVFTALGQGSSGYQYQFWFYDGITWNMVQDFGVGSTWTLSALSAPGNYTVGVRVKTSALAAWDAVANMAYSVYPGSPATGVTLTPDQASPQPAGTAVVFTALGQGSSGYQYQFWFFDGTSWSMVQDYGVGSTWTLSALSAPGNYTVGVRVKTSALAAWDAVANMTYTVSGLPATGVTLTPDLPSPHPAGTAVVFTALGQGSSGYQYQFWFYNGTSWSMVQDYGVGSTWTLPALTTAGNYTVGVRVKTSALAAWDAVANMAYTVQ